MVFCSRTLESDDRAFLRPSQASAAEMKSRRVSYFSQVVQSRGYSWNESGNFTELSNPTGYLFLPLKCINGICRNSKGQESVDVKFVSVLRCENDSVFFIDETITRSTHARVIAGNEIR